MILRFLDRAIIDDYIEILKQRTKKFAIEIVKLISLFPKNTASFVVGNQLCKSGTSVAANYRAAT